jgi:TPR repeat protein
VVPPGVLSLVEPPPVVVLPPVVVRKTKKPAKQRGTLPTPAVAALEQSCAKTDGNHDADCGALARALAQGDGVVADPARAFALAYRSCSRGDSGSCQVLTVMFYRGIWANKDEKTVKRLLELLCDGGAAESCGSLGVLLTQGDKPDYGKAIEAFEKGCVAPSPSGEACNDLAWELRRGQHTKKDTTRALKLFRSACDQMKSPIACANLGLMVEDGEGIERDYRSMVALLDKGCEGKHAPACRYLGLVYWWGRWEDDTQTGRARTLVPECEDDPKSKSCDELQHLGAIDKVIRPDTRKAVDCWRRGCDLSDPESCWRMASAYRRGIGVTKDVKKSLEIDERNCSAGDFSSCNRLIAIYSEENKARAFALAYHQCELENGDACTLLGKMNIDGTWLSKSGDAAAEAFEKGCNLKPPNADSCNLLGVILYTQTDPKLRDLPRARSLFAAACQGKDVAGCNNLGWLDVELKRVADGIKELGQACDGDYAMACHNLGLLYSDGKAVPANAPRAQQFYRKACQLKDAEACKLAHD